MFAQIKETKETKSITQPSSIVPWVEKYRPSHLADISHQDHAVAALKTCRTSNNLQHLLLYGPPGSGKTTSILALCQELFGPELIKKRVLELNASDDRGINMIRDKVGEFAKVATNANLTHDSKYPCPPYKIIILDEADSMTREAQSALHRTMELYSHNTRFCIICNYVSKLSEPIRSRCARYRFEAIPLDKMIARLKHICQSEYINIKDEALSLLVSLVEGDLRKAITFLQGSQRLLKAGEEIKEDHVLIITGHVPRTVITSLIIAIKSSNFKKLEKTCMDVIYEAFPIHQVLKQLSTALINDSEITDMAKSLASMRIADADLKLVQNADEYLQLMDIMSFVAKIII